MTKQIDVATLTEQRIWSLETFGPGSRTTGVLKHIEKELKEVAAKPEDAEEWMDIVILAFDGAMREGHDPEHLLNTWLAKIRKNMLREWPNWRDFGADEPIEHVRAVVVTDDGTPPATFILEPGRGF